MFCISRLTAQEMFGLVKTTGLFCVVDDSVDEYLPRRKYIPNPCAHIIDHIVEFDVFYVSSQVLYIVSKPKQKV